MPLQMTKRLYDLLAQASSEQERDHLHDVAKRLNVRLAQASSEVERDCILAAEDHYLSLLGRTHAGGAGVRRASAHP